MKRFWLLLLAFVLPMQMSWAAVHFCEEDAPVSIALAASGAKQELHSQSQADTGANKAGAQQADPLADACCTAAHGCHGLHNLMAPPQSAFADPDAAALRAASNIRGAERAFSARHERPQWPAA